MHYTCLTGYTDLPKANTTALTSNALPAMAA